MSSKTDNEYMQSIQSMISTYVYHAPQGIPRQLNTEFCHDIDPDRIPLQGWKFHVSVRDLADYENVLKKLLPKLEEQGIQYKVLNPAYLQGQLQSAQKGKAITIYPTPGCDLRKLFYKNPLSATQRLMNQDAVDIYNEQKIQGRVFARFGELRGGTNHSLLDPQGILTTEVRGQAVKPDFVSTEPSIADITNFYTQSVNRAGQTRNYKDFIEETFLGTHTWGCAENPEWDSRRHNFITINFPHEQYDRVKAILENNGQGFSRMFKTPDAEYGMIRNTDANRILTALEREGIPYNRPEWDKMYNVTVIHPDDRYIMESAVAQHAALNGQHYGLTPMEMYELPNGMLAVKYDTVQDKDFFEMCQYNQVRTYDMMLGKQQQQIWEHWGPVATQAMNILSNQLEQEKAQAIDLQDAQSFDRIR